MPFSIQNISEITDMDLDELFKVVHEMENTRPDFTHTESKNNIPHIPSAEDLDYYDKFIQNIHIPHDWPHDDRPKPNDFPFDVNYNPHDYNYNNHKDFGYNSPDLSYDTRHDNHKDHPGIGMIFGFLGVILCGTLIFLAVYLIHRCYKNNEDVAAGSNGRNNTTRPTNSSNHCVENGQRGTNANSDRPLLSVITHNPNQLDLPPAYADSTNNSATVCPHGLNNPQASDAKDSKYTAPPTYDEAVANIVPSAPVCEICTSPSAPPDYQYKVDSSNSNRS